MTLRLSVLEKKMCQQTTTTNLVRVIFDVVDDEQFVILEQLLLAIALPFRLFGGCRSLFV